MSNSPASLRKNAREGFILSQIYQFDLILIMAPVVTLLGSLQVVAVSCLHLRPGPSTQRSISLQKSKVHSTGILQTHDLTCIEVNSTVFANTFI